MEERDDEDEEDEEILPAMLTLAILIASAVIALAFAIVVGLTLRHHSASAPLKHPAAALQQTDPISGR